MMLLFGSHLMACIWGLLGRFNLEASCNAQGEAEYSIASLRNPR